ncbi:hypothetical protein LAM19_22340, partial [Mycobacterium tuberculosis]|nr:hypothetical protein [Mycobacterium tuberculosis]
MEAYQDDPAQWSKAIGDRLWFQFGVYDDPQSPRPADLDESGLRYFERQLKIAGLDTPGRQPRRRVHPPVADTHLSLPATAPQQCSVGAGPRTS